MKRTPLALASASGHIRRLAAQAANAAKTRFLANMSHQLRTPLNAIIGFSEIIAQQLFGEIGNSRYVEYSSDILRYPGAVPL